MSDVVEDLPEFTVVRGRFPNPRHPDDDAVVVKIGGLWVPPGDECWSFDSDDDMRNGPHHLVDIEVVARPVDSR